MGNIYCDRILEKGRRDEVVFSVFKPQEAACDMDVLKSCWEMKKRREKKCARVYRAAGRANEARLCRRRAGDRAISVCSGVHTNIPTSKSNPAHTSTLYISVHFTMQGQLNSDE